MVALLSLSGQLHILSHMKMSNLLNASAVLTYSLVIKVCCDGGHLHRISSGVLTPLTALKRGNLAGRNSCFDNTKSLVLG